MKMYESARIKESVKVSLAKVFEFFSGEIYDGDVPPDVAHALDSNLITWQAAVNPIILSEDIKGILLYKNTGMFLFDKKVVFLLKKYQWNQQ